MERIISRTIGFIEDQISFGGSRAKLGKRIVWGVHRARPATDLLLSTRDLALRLARWWPSIRKWSVFVRGAGPFAVRSRHQDAVMKADFGNHGFKDSED